ncbi:MAG: hypothetical protein MZV65_32820, partial [Chromatiales bacterium]|nr:hypothetical protein [Chromatiales bacterium]
FRPGRTEIDTLKSRLQEQQKRSTEFSSNLQLAERDQYSQIASLDEEPRQAEGQIELIKDLLPRNELGQRLPPVGVAG